MRPCEPPRRVFSLPFPITHQRNPEPNRPVAFLPDCRHEKVAKPLSGNIRSRMATIPKGRFDIRLGDSNSAEKLRFAFEGKNG